LRVTVKFDSLTIWDWHRPTVLLRFLVMLSKKVTTAESQTTPHNGASTWITKV